MMGGGRGVLVMLAVIVVLGPSLAAAISPAESFTACINEGNSDAPTTYKDFVAGRPVRLRVRKAWSSAKAPRVPLTVVTGLTASRLDQLEAQCASWRGPLSAAVYVVVKSDGAGGISEEGVAALEKAEADVAAFHKKTETLEGGCQLDTALLYEVVADDVMTLLLPINVMRNYGLLQARTRLIAMVDVDLIVSSALSDWMADPKNVDFLHKECAAKRVYVLPAFETPRSPDASAAHKVAGDAVAGDKAALEALVAKKLVHQFALYLFREGHNMTEYNKWFRADKPYPVGWTKDYEPWFIADRFLNPFYDSVFRGYGWNKVTQVTNVHGSGFSFFVHPQGWIVHRQHDRSGADKLYQSQKKKYEDDAKADPRKGDANTSLAGMTHRFRNRILAQLAAGGYEPAVDAGAKACLATLPWWQQRDGSGSGSGSSPAAAGGAGDDYDKRRRRVLQARPRGAAAAAAAA